MKEVDRRAYIIEPGRSFSPEYAILSKPAEVLADRIPADAITAVGAVAGITGSFLLGFPEEAIQRAQRISGGRLTPSIKQLKIAGGIALGVSYLCDLLDGAVARKSTGGETKHGKVFDGIVNKAVDTSPAIFELFKAKSLDTKATWLSYVALAPVSTMIRSIGLSHDIPITKTGLGARVGRVPVLISSLLFERKRNLFGKLLVMQLIADSIHRYKQITNSGNNDARDNVNHELVRYFMLVLLGRTIPQRLPRELAMFGLALAKLAQIKIREAYKDQHEKESLKKTGFMPSWVIK